MEFKPRLKPYLFSRVGLCHVYMTECLYRVIQPFFARISRVGVGLPKPVWRRSRYPIVRGVKPTFVYVTSFNTVGSGYYP